MKSVSSQTEDSCCPRSAPKAHELQCASTQTEEVEEEQGEEAPVESPPVSPVPAAVGAVLGDRMLFSGSFPIPADPVRLAERIRRNRTQLSAAFDDTEYEPYGLPEVVKKGNYTQYSTKTVSMKFFSLLLFYSDHIFSVSNYHTSTPDCKLNIGYPCFFCFFQSGLYLFLCFTPLPVLQDLQTSPLGPHVLTL